MMKIIYTTLILVVLVPAIGVTAQELMSEQEYINSLFNEPLLVGYIWNWTILVLCGGYKVIKYIREDY